MHASPTSLQRFPSTDVRYWQGQLTHRIHGRLARSQPFPELSARIDHAGESVYFPLGTDIPKKAAGVALQIYRKVMANGWEGVFRQHPHEFTLAIFWAENPMVFTYTTLYTKTRSGNGAPLRSLNRRPSQGQRTVAIIEPNQECRRGLGEWINTLSEYACCGLFPSSVDALKELKHRTVDLLFFNRQLPDSVVGGFLRSFRGFAPRTPAFGYQTYDISDELFTSQPVVSGGYYFRRRAPDKLLEPIQGLANGGALEPEECLSRISNYVQKRFRFPPEREDVRDTVNLTSREHDILSCLRQGSSDKEIARALNISAWTVHTHLKRIYEKLGVQSRTQAVVRYLQK